MYDLRTVCAQITTVRVSNENVPMWINHVFHMISPVLSTRIMRGPVTSCVTVKIAIHVLRRLKCRSIVHQSKFGRSRLTLACISNMSHDLAVYSSSFPINQASIPWLTLQPVVYVAFDKDLSANLLPLREAYGVVVCVVQGRSCRDWNIHFRVRWPIWSWCYCV